MVYSPLFLWCQIVHLIALHSIRFGFRVIHACVNSARLSDTIDLIPKISRFDVKQFDRYAHVRRTMKCLPFRDTDGEKSRGFGWDWWRDRERERSKWLRWSSITLLTTCPSEIEAGTVRNRCKACETWLWKGPKNIVPAKRIPIVPKRSHGKNQFVFKSTFGYFAKFQIHIELCVQSE